MDQDAIVVHRAAGRSLASGSAITERAKSRFKENINSNLQKIVGEDISKIDAGVVARAAMQGDFLRLRLWKKQQIY